MKLAQYHFVNGQILTKEEARVSAFDLGLLRGYGIFDFFRINDGIAMYVEEHISRFESSAESLGLVIPFDSYSLKKWIYQLVELNQIEYGSIKLILTGGISDDGFNISPQATLVIICNHLPHPATQSISTIKLMTIDYLRELPGVKTLNYIVPIQKWKEMADKGFQDLLYVKNKIVSESSRSNIFMFNGQNTLITPDKDILLGVTRHHVLEIAKKYFEIEIRPVLLDEVKQAKEVFITSSTKSIISINQIDSNLIDDGTIGTKTTFLHQALTAYQENYKKHSTKT